MGRGKRDSVRLFTNDVFNFEWTTLLPVGGGRAVIDTLSQRAAGLGVEILYEATAWKLLLDEEGVVDSLMVRAKGGTSVELKVGAVVLASGGFQGNREMMAQYIGRDAHKIRTVCEGGLFNKGEAIRMAMDIGARPAGQFDAFHAEPVDPRSNREEGVVMTYPYAILVDKNGKRFVDEGKSTVDEQYEQVARTIFYDLPDHIAYMIVIKRCMTSLIMSRHWKQINLLYKRIPLKS